MVKHVVRAFAGSAAGLKIPDVAFHHPEMRCALERAEDFVQIFAMAGRKVVDTDNCLPEREELLKEVGADEPGDSCDDPDFGSRDQLFAEMGIRCEDHELGVEEYPPGRFRAVARGSTSTRSCAPHVAAF